MNQPDIKNLKDELNKVHTEKEKWFQEKEELKKKILETISRIKSFKTDNKTLTEKAQQLKDERDFHNAKVRELITSFKELSKESKTKLKALGIKADPARILQHIEHLEQKIETEAISFTKEKQVMEEIKKLRKQLDQAGTAQALTLQITTLSKAIDEEKQKAQEAHDVYKAFLKDYKKDTKELISLSKQVGAFKKKQEEAFQLFLDFKKKFEELNSKLKDQLVSFKERTFQKQKSHAKPQGSSLPHEEKLLKEKAKEIEEKIKDKKKLTTQDLIAYQAQKEEPLDEEKKQ